MFQPIYMFDLKRLAGILLLALMMMLSTQAPVCAESINSFVQYIHLLNDGVLDVQENILIDFGDSTRQALYRVIPVEYQGFGGSYHVDVKLISVTNENYQPVEFTQNRLGSTFNIRISRVQGQMGNTHIYRLHYLVRRAVCFFQRTQVCWNATGDAWPMVIREAEITLVPPPNVNQADISVRGYLGSGVEKPGEARPMMAEAQPPGFVLHASDLRPAQSLYLVASLPNGALHEPSLFQQMAWFLADWWPAIVLPLLTLSGLTAVFWVCGRNDVPPQAISAQITPPARLSPAEVGTLVDECCDLHDISSTLVHLAVRGYIRIEEISGEGFLSLSNKDYLLTGLKSFDDPELWPHERLLLKSVFAASNGENPPVSRLSALKGKFFAQLPAIKRAVYADLTNKGQFTCSPDEVEKSYYGGGIALAIIGVVVCLALRQAGHLWPAVGNGLVISGLLVLIFAPLMQARTALGTQALAQTRALERFMLTAGWVGLPWAEADKPAVFERLLPYAMVLGVSDKWAEAFHGMLKEQPSWYRINSQSTMTDGFSSEYFVSNLGNGMRTVEKVLASQAD
jgi:hypothetical protein